MQDISKLCMICLSVKDENDVCPRCKKNIAVRQEAPLLPLKCIIAERYCIAKAMKRNGEGVTYAAYDLKQDKAVSIREFFPESIASRSYDELTVVPAAGSESDYSGCRASFIELWTKLMRLKGLSALISVTDVFQANSTAYAVYEESELVNLNGYLNNTADGYMPWEKARILFLPVLSTLGTLHTSGVFHRGINPRSFVFSKDGKLKLTDFCAEQARTILSDIEPELFDGYTPLEQYDANGNIGAWSDIYSFCAVIYRTLIGKDPIDARTRAQEDKLMIPAKFAELIPSYVINALINGMQLEPDNRTRNIEQLRSNLSTVQRTFESSVVTHTTDPSKYTAPSHIGEPVVTTRERTDNPITSYNSYAQRMQGLQTERNQTARQPAAPVTPPRQEPSFTEPLAGYGQPVSSGFVPRRPSPDATQTQYVNTAEQPAPPVREPEPAAPVPPVQRPAAPRYGEQFPTGQRYEEQIPTGQRYAEPEEPPRRPSAPRYEEPADNRRQQPRYEEPAEERRQPRYPDRREPSSTAGERVDEYRRAVEEVRRLDEEKKEKKKRGLIVLLIFLVLLLIGVGVFIANELLHIVPNGLFNNTETTTAAAAMVKVPNFKMEKIETILSKENYTKNFEIRQTEQNSDTVPKGTVIDQDIPADTFVQQGTVITLTVSAGPKMVVIPDDLAGKTYAEAEAELTALGFKCSKSYRQNDGTHVADTVAETSPLAKSEVKDGTLVIIVLWKEAETTAPVIDIGEQSQTVATTRSTPSTTQYVPPTTRSTPPVTAAPTEPEREPSSSDIPETEEPEANE